MYSVIGVLYMLTSAYIITCNKDYYIINYTKKQQKVKYIKLKYFQVSELKKKTFALIIDSMGLEFEV